MPGLVPPYGGELKDRLVEADRARALVAGSRAWPSWYLTPAQLGDLELLLSGGFSPLEGFMGRRDYESVCADMRLADGTLWPIPIVLAVSQEAASEARAGQLPRFTGVSDPYEPPEDAEVVVDTAELDAEQAADRVLSHLARRGLVPGEGYSPSGDPGEASASPKL